LDWSKLKHFKADSQVDKWGDSTKLDETLLLKLDRFREKIGLPVIVTSGFRPGDKGQHGLGRAVDFVVPQWRGGLLDLYFHVERMGFTGIGIYRDWVYANQKVYGVHVDMREGEASRWFCVKKGAEERILPKDLIGLPQVYLPLNTAALYEYHVL
jgi:uncharacterized protein YcbK (DUF882 family)